MAVEHQLELQTESWDLTSASTLTTGVVGIRRRNYERKALMVTGCFLKTFSGKINSYSKHPTMQAHAATRRAGAAFYPT
jgi:hypothetical protein